jgi:hypothetical protein
MDQAMSDLAAPDPMAPCSSVVASCDNNTEVRAAPLQGKIKRADPDVQWVTLPGPRMERWITDNPDWEAPRVRHRRLH